MECLQCKSGVTSFLSQRICQDPLENFFGCQRQRGGVHDNPNVQEFVKNTQALRVINSFCKGPSQGNCRGGLKLVSNSRVTKRMNLSPNAERLNHILNPSNHPTDLFIFTVCAKQTFVFMCKAMLVGWYVQSKYYISSCADCVDKI